MTKTVANELAEFGQSIWLDNINRAMINNGKLKEMVGLGLRGMTSNPTIFDKAISVSADYDEKILELHQEGKSTFEIYDCLTVRDVQDAADILKAVYQETDGLDGYVSLEVSPELAFDTQKTVEEAKRLHKKAKRANVMFKVPATKEGFKAIEELTACGINVNVTLIFSLEQYSDTAQFYLRGIKRFIENKGDCRRVRSVASVFVSRIDTIVDGLLEEKIVKGKDRQKNAELSLLKGKAAVANSGLIYRKYLDIFSSGEFKKLKDKGANIQRVLWGSTSTKSPGYSDIKYVSELIAKGTVNTMPENTWEAFLGHGKVKEALSADIEDARKVIDGLKDFDVDIGVVCAKLLRDGVAAFQESFESLLHSIEEKANPVRN